MENNKEVINPCPDCESNDCYVSEMERLKVVMCNECGNTGGISPSRDEAIYLWNEDS